MMDLFNSLMSMGGGAAQSAPTDMSQVKVPVQAMDLSSTVTAANDQVKYNPQATGTDWGAIGMGALQGVASATGGRQQGSQGLMQPRGFNGGGQEHQMVSGASLSGARASDTSPLFKNGLMGV